MAGTRAQQGGQVSDRDVVDVLGRGRRFRPERLVDPSLVQPSTKAAILSTVYFTDMGYSCRVSVLIWMCRDSRQHCGL
jgi:hypothetical protein